MSEYLNIYPNDNFSFNIDNFSSHNANEFVSFKLTLEKEGELIDKQEFTLDIEPEHNYWYFLEAPDDLKGGEYVFTLFANQSKTEDGVRKGTELASAQKIFTVESKEDLEEVEYEDLKVDEDETDVTFSGEGFKAKFSKVLGGLVDLEYDGITYLKTKPTVTFWRPLTDTDIHLGLNYDNAPWIAATVGQQYLPEKYYFKQDGKNYELTFVYRYPVPGGIESAVIYTVRPGGVIEIKTTYAGLATMDTLPAFAMEFRFNKDLDQFRYYGYGPDQTYIDTTEGTNLSVYTQAVKKNFPKEGRPQESGNRTGVRWADVYNKKSGKGLRFSCVEKPFEFDALPYSTLEIETAQTQEELPRVSSTNVRIAAAVSGIGDGESLADWARVDAGEMFDLNFTIQPATIEQPKAKAAPKKAEEKEPKKEEPKKVEAKEVKKVEPKKAETKEAKKEEPKKAEPKKVETKEVKKEEPKKAEPKKVEAKEVKKVEPKKAETKEAKKEEPKKVEAKEAKKAEPKEVKAKETPESKKEVENKIKPKPKKD